MVKIRALPQPSPAVITTSIIITSTNSAGQLLYLVTRSHYTICFDSYSFYAYDIATFEFIIVDMHNQE